jgi:hypothetical protein
MKLPTNYGKGISIERRSQNGDRLPCYIIPQNQHHPMKLSTNYGEGISIER